MKLNGIILSGLIGLVLMGCTFSEVTENQKTQTKASDARPDRNMFGVGIPRGLILNTEETKPGYVMFMPPNSSISEPSRSSNLLLPNLISRRSLSVY